MRNNLVEFLARKLLDLWIANDVRCALSARSIQAVATGAGRGEDALRILDVLILGVRSKLRFF